MGKRRDRAAAVGALAVALAEPEPGVRGLAVSVLHSAFGGSWGRDAAPGVVPPEAARALLDNVLKQAEATVQQAVPAAVNAAMLTGQAEPLYGALAKPEHAALRASAYPYLMTMGRLRAFPKVQELVKESEPSLAEAAAEAPINMDAWTEAEQKAICDWSDGLLSDQRPGVAAKASLLLSHCSGAKLDRLLARADELAAAGKLDATAQGPLIAMCGGAQRPKTLTATSAQCARSRKLLVSVAESKQADASARAQAVTWFAQIWPDEASAKLLKRLKGDANAVVARQAGDSLKRLDEAAALQSAQMSSTSSQSKP
jgi:HEAT repeat protein